MYQSTAEYLLHYYSLEFLDRPATRENETLTGLWDRYEALPEHSPDKAMRWLGFAQGVAYALNLYTLDEIKEHSRFAVALLEREKPA